MPLLGTTGAAAARGFGMFGVSAVTDPYFEYVAMLLPGNGTNGAQNNTFTDSSTNNFSITRNGNTMQGTFSPYGSNWSNYFGAASTKISTTSMTQLGSDFTLECWIFPTSFADYNTIFDNRTSDGDSAGFVLGLTSAAKVYFYTNSAFQITTTTAITANTWNHIALVRSGSGSGNVKIYINGVADATTATYTTSFTRTAPSIGDDWNTRSNLQFYGYISNLRATTGALYTGTFTPSTVPLTTTVSAGTCVLLTCQSNRFIDNSASALSISVTASPNVQRFSPFSPTASYSTTTVGGSGYFDGTGDSLALTMTGGVGSGDFTIEYWIYPTSFYNYITAFSTTRGTTGLNVGTQASAQIVLYIDGSGEVLRGTTAMKANSWNHCAFTKSGSTYRGYLNGVLDATGSNSNSLTATGASIGSLDNSSEYFTGYLCDVRVVSGTALYTGSTLTVPTAPLTAVSNTRLLTNFTNAGIIDNAMMNDLETVGNAQISTTQSKFGGSSIYLDGTGDWLLAPSTPNCSFETGDFTLEGWIYPTATTGTDRCIWETRAVDSDSGMVLFIDTNGKLSTYTSNAIRLTSTNSVTANTWQHFALVRSSGTMAFYIDGVQNGTLSYSTTITCPGLVRIGVRRDGAQPYTGYIDDFRVTKGYARYTATFTPPSRAFPTF